MCDWLLFCLDMGAGRLGRAEAVAACSGEAMLDSAMPLHLLCWYSTCQTCAALRCAGLGRSLLSLHAARELSVVGGWSSASAYVRPAGTAVGDSVAAHGLQLRVLVRCVWYSICHGGDPMVRGRCCWLHGRCQISRRSNPNPSSAMLNAAPGERAEQRHCSAPSPSPLAPAATSSDHR